MAKVCAARRSRLSEWIHDDAVVRSEPVIHRQAVALRIQKSLNQPGIKTTIDKIPSANWRAAIQKDVEDFTKITYDDVPRVLLFQPLVSLAIQPNISGYRYWFHRQLDLRNLAKRWPTRKQPR